MIWLALPRPAVRQMKFVHPTPFPDRFNLFPVKNDPVRHTRESGYDENQLRIGMTLPNNNLSLPLGNTLLLALLRLGAGRPGSALPAR
jgi:hypothetical protein